MNSPDELLMGLETDKLPDDLKWMMGRFKMEPTDPVFLLLAWHWLRINQSQDMLHQENLAFKAVFETQVKKIQEHLTEWQKVATTIDKFQTVVTDLTKDMGRQLDGALRQPVSAALASTQQLTGQLNGILQKAEAQNKQIKWHLPIACLLAGFAFGAGLIPWTFSLLLAH